MCCFLIKSFYPSKEKGHGAKTLRFSNEALGFIYVVVTQDCKYYIIHDKIEFTKVCLNLSLGNASSTPHFD